MGTIPRVGPHLKTIDDVKYCSLCNKAFPEDSKPSISKAFAAHVRQDHKKPERIRKEEATLTSLGTL